MKKFLDDDFLLHSEEARKLYHDYAAGMPIIDYHNHLPPDQIAANTRFENPTQVWLNGDHYKWRAMRANGVAEKFITGDADDRAKFRAWAATVPYTLRNPLYHWTHLELKRYFGIHWLLGPDTADKTYDAISEQLASPEYRVRGLLKKMKVERLCTTDDPADSLEHHIQLKQEGFGIEVLPSFRPDAVLQLDQPGKLRPWLERLGARCGTRISDFSSLLKCLRQRHEFFASTGCIVSDHGLEEMYFDPVPEETVTDIFDRFLQEQPVTETDIRRYRSFLLLEFARWDHHRNWVQQFHLGALRNNNERKLAELGPDTGWDSIGDWPLSRNLAAFLNALEKESRLGKTILYNLNPALNEMMATMTGNFNDGSIPGKIQWGAAWWFLDQKDGMISHLNALSNMGLLSRFVGMLTDSRSFLSFPRHEYFRRILCNLIGAEMKQGELPQDYTLLGNMVQRICYYNAKEYFETGNSSHGA